MPVLELYGIVFEWHDNKFELVYNGREISFEEVCSVFIDPYEYTSPDNRFDYDENRMVTTGISKQARLLTVAWVARNDTIRIITAFEPTKAQIKAYQHANKRY